MTALDWQLLRPNERLQYAAHRAMTLFVQAHDGIRYGFDNVPVSMFRALVASERPRRFISTEIDNRYTCTWSGRCCDNSPCKEDAMWRGEVARIEFHLCRQCSRDDRFIDVKFTKMVAPAIPKRRARQAA